MEIRPVRWPADAAAIAALDPSFATDQIVRVHPTPTGWTLLEVPVRPPLHKRLANLAEELDDLREMEHVVVATAGDRILGVAAATYAAWNRRVKLWHLYVDAAARRQGAGQALLRSVDAYAAAQGARCIWLEVTNVNLPAIRFYRRAGFRLCGLDETLYDPEGPGGGEAALFMARDVAGGEPGR